MLTALHLISLLLMCLYDKTGVSILSEAGKHTYCRVCVCVQNQTLISWSIFGVKCSQINLKTCDAKPQNAFPSGANVRHCVLSISTFSVHEFLLNKLALPILWKENDGIIFYYRLKAKSVANAKKWEQHRKKNVRNPLRNYAQLTQITLNNSVQWFSLVCTLLCVTIWHKGRERERNVAWSEALRRRGKSARNNRL